MPIQSLNVGDGATLPTGPANHRSWTPRLGVLAVSAARYRRAFLTSASVVFLLFALVQPFAQNLRAVGRYSILSAIWGILFAISGSIGARWLLAFYLALYGAILHIDRSNFGVLSAHEARTWTVLIVCCFCGHLLILATVDRVGRWLAMVVSTVVMASLLVLPFAIIAYTHATGARFTENSIRAVLQTNVGEALDFGRQFIGFEYGLILLGVLAVVVCLTARSRVQVGNRTSKQLAIVLLIAAAVLVTSVKREVNRFRPYKSRLAASAIATILTYRSELKQFREIFDRRASELPVINAAREGVPRTFVVILGESQNKTHMGAYGYHRDTTPWLSHAVAAGQVTLFDNVYSSHTLTVNVLGKALTEATQYNGKQFYTSASLIDVANAAGFKTTWITNQPFMGGWDNIVSAIAGFAGSFVKLNPYWGFRVTSAVHDEAAVDALKGVAASLDASTNNLIVVHLMGNHSPYCQQFPSDRAAFRVLPEEAFGELAEKADLAAEINCYDNSILYNDHVVQQLFQTSTAIPNVGFIFYVADHGEAVTQRRGHNPDLFDFNMTRIPMFIWFAEQYGLENAARVGILRERAARHFTNDLVYDTLLGLMGMSTVRYSRHNDLSDPSFAYSVDALRTLDGQLAVTADPLLIERRFVSQQDARQILAYRCNNLRMMQDARTGGLAGFEIDVALRGGGSTQDDFFEVSSAGGKRSAGRLDDYLSYAERIGYERVIIHFDGLHDGGVPRALEALGALGRRHQNLHERAILRVSRGGPSLSPFRQRGWHTSYELANDEIRDAQARGDGELRRLAQTIAKEMAEQNADAISFDVSMYSFVNKYLAPLIKPDIVYHGQAPGMLPWLEQVAGESGSHEWSRDARLVTLEVPVLSDVEQK